MKQEKTDTLLNVNVKSDTLNINMNIAWVISKNILRRGDSLSRRFSSIEQNIYGNVLEPFW